MSRATPVEMNGTQPVGLPRLLPPARVDLDTHLAQYGPLPVVHSRAQRAQLIDTVDRSGLRGRGGAGFPTGRKLRAVADKGRRNAVVANAAESEPASFKDAILITRAPHLVLDGAVIAANAVRADTVYLVIERRDPAVRAVVDDAIAARAATDPVRIEMVTVPSRYVAGEESAAVNFINTGVAKPTFVPPRPFERGVRGRPTLVQNVETLANVALIARYGADWFRTVGTREEPGSLLVTLTGAVAQPGVYEFPVGTPVLDVLGAAHTPLDTVGAMLVGGYFGNWLPPSALPALRLTHASLREAGGTLGSGVIGVLSDRSCGIAETARITRYLAEESAEQCGPCIYGVRALADAMDALARRVIARDTVPNLRRWLDDVAHRGACHLPDGAVGLVASSLRVFADDVEAHSVHGRCIHANSRAVLPIPDEATRDRSWT
jgi:NADH:ubiquinone oxidoreductase subunit F (NADH-binding)